MKLREILGDKDYEFIEVRTISTNGNGGRDDVYYDCFGYVGGEIQKIGWDEFSLDDVFEGYAEWNSGEGIEFNGNRNINMTVWRVHAGVK